MIPRKSLSEILAGAGKDADALEKAWGETQAATDFAPLPKGDYEAVVTHGELFSARTGTPGYKLTFEVCEGDFKGRKFWHDVYLTPAALPIAKRDLAKIGIAELQQLERPLPARFRCQVKLALRKEDDGSERNRVIRFDCIGIEKADPFAPVDPAPAANADDDGEPFPFGANAPACNGSDPGPYERSERR
jgi:hypothetical protein